jgi:transposase
LYRTLEVYLQDDRMEIDNNLVENACSPTALAKKNWLSIGETGAAQCGAIIFTRLPQSDQPADP